MFLVDRLMKTLMVKIFGKSKIYEFNTGNDKDGDEYYNPYFKTILKSDGSTIMKIRELPNEFPNEIKLKVLKVKKVCYYVDESLFGMNISNFLNKIFGIKNNNKSRRLGFGYGPILQILPVIGNYILLLINIWILFNLIEIGIGFNIKFKNKKFNIIKTNDKFLNPKEIGNMVFNILVDFGIGFIPFVGSFISIVHRSSSRNLSIFWKSMDKKYNKLNDIKEENKLNDIKEENNLNYI